jgi:hypothetical protein
VPKSIVVPATWTGRVVSLFCCSTVKDILADPWRHNTRQLYVVPVITVVPSPWLATRERVHIMLHHPFSIIRSTTRRENQQPLLYSLRRAVSYVHPSWTTSNRAAVQIPMARALVSMESINAWVGKTARVK